jgi:hypothetical protein
MRAPEIGAIHQREIEVRLTQAGSLQPGEFEMGTVEQRALQMHARKIRSLQMDTSVT